MPGRNDECKHQRDLLSWEENVLILTFPKHLWSHRFPWCATFSFSKSVHPLPMAFCCGQWWKNWERKRKPFNYYTINAMLKILPDWSSFKPLGPYRAVRLDLALTMWKSSGLNDLWYNLWESHEDLLWIKTFYYVSVSYDSYWDTHKFSPAVSFSLSISKQESENTLPISQLSASFI